jgi:PTS system nitrogen regulatory IIA component
MNRIAKLLPARNVLLDLQVPDGSRLSKRRIFEQAALLFENEHGVERGKVFDSLFARERLGSTGLGQAVAIPHGRIKGLKEAVAAVVRVVEPIPFEAPDGELVKLFVFLLVPEHATEEHLEILSELAELLSNANIRSALLSAQDGQQVHQVLANWEPYRPAA